MAASSFPVSPQAPPSYGCFASSLHSSRLAQPSSSWRASAHDLAKLPSQVSHINPAFASSLLHKASSPRTAQIRRFSSHEQIQEEQELEAVVEAKEEAKIGEAEGLVQAAASSAVAGPTVEEAKAAVLYQGRKFVDLKKGRGAVIADVLMVFGGLLDRPFGSGRSMAGAGEVVIERVVKETEILRGQGGVDEQLIFELLRVLRLLEMDLELLSAARKDETLLQRLEGAKLHCRQAILIANAM